MLSSVGFPSPTGREKPERAPISFEAKTELDGLPHRPVSSWPQRKCCNSGRASPLMGWSGQAPALPAFEAGKGRQKGSGLQKRATAAQILEDAGRLIATCAWRNDVTAWRYGVSACMYTSRLRYRRGVTALPSRNDMICRHGNTFHSSSVSGASTSARRLDPCPWRRSACVWSTRTSEHLIDQSYGEVPDRTENLPPRQATRRYRKTLRRTQVIKLHNSPALIFRRKWRSRLKICSLGLAHRIHA